MPRTDGMAGEAWAPIFQPPWKSPPPSETLTPLMLISRDAIESPNAHLRTSVLTSPAPSRPRPDEPARRREGRRPRPGGQVSARPCWGRCPEGSSGRREACGGDRPSPGRRAGGVAGVTVHGTHRSRAVSLGSSRFAAAAPGRDGGAARGGRVGGSPAVPAPGVGAAGPTQLGPRAVSLRTWVTDVRGGVRGGYTAPTLSSKTSPRVDLGGAGAFGFRFLLPVAS